MIGSERNRTRATTPSCDADPEACERARRRSKKWAKDNPEEHRTQTREWARANRAKVERTRKAWREVQKARMYAAILLMDGEGVDVADPVLKVS